LGKPLTKHHGDVRFVARLDVLARLMTEIHDDDVIINASRLGTATTLYCRKFALTSSIAITHHPAETL
jgi:hypothetical protein